ncbi:PREDICTED: LOW QUALITY PROTEIN: scavenger receptor cysteine-rich type 1 protein M130-like, partial [Calidris pugnax]|uniref:LOW QUALITY PROTEIN: scavenger receptor cysteine-rich type 1 protein M130-like n=1 Tax=Calidris pugnax TaxID=198806 RepID=UPI00071D7110
TGELRLVGGGGRCAGRGEGYHEGEWGSVCVYDFDWEAHWATVVCRQLGCGSVAKASVFAPFGEGTGRIWLQPFCHGTEKRLQDCLHLGWGQNFCGHRWDIGVTCTAGAPVQRRWLRLAAGGGPCAGRVEVKLQGQWGTVADNYWDMEDAEVVCQQLGCGSATGAYMASSRFGRGSGPVSLGMIDCKGTETALWDCEVLGWGPYIFLHDLDTSVVCQGFARLVGGPDACAGRLEVRSGRAWVGVCQDEVDIKMAQVVCRALGCGEALAVPGASHFEAGTGPLWEGGFDCTGTEPLLASCTRRPRRGQGCSGHATVICSRKHLGTAGGCWGVPPLSPPKPTALFAAAYTGFRLAGNESGCAGRVEVEAGGTWGSLCASGWDLPDAHVLCRHLGCGPSAPTVPPGGSFGGGDGRLRPDAFGCGGSERHPGECPTVRLGEPPCPPGHAAAVTCSGGYGREKALRGPQKACPEPFLGLPKSGERRAQGRCGAKGRLCPHGSPGDVVGVAEPLRLVEGESRCDGRLEVATGPGAWASVAAGPWDAQGASVVCRQLGCGVPEKVYAVPGSGTAALPGLRCDGTEENLAQCNVSGTATTLTSSSKEVATTLTSSPEEVATTPTGSPEEVAIICSAPQGATPSPSPPCPAGSRRVRLAGGSGRCAGRVEVYVQGSWASVCQEKWDLPDATVVCRQLGCGTALVALGSDGFGPGTGPAWPDAGGCAGSEASLWDCPSPAGHGCRRGGGASAICSGGCPAAPAHGDHQPWGWGGSCPMRAVTPPLYPLAEHRSLRLVGGRERCSGHLEVFYKGTWGRVCANGTSPETASAVCQQLGCGAQGRLVAAPSPSPSPAWLAWVGCQEGTRWLWRCPSAPWHLQPCSPDGDAHVTCDGDMGMPTPSPGSRCPEGATCTGSSAHPDVPSSTTVAATSRRVPVPTVLCVVLGTLLCLVLGALAVQTCRARAWCRGPGRATGAVSDAIYEELDCTLTPEYQEVPSRPGSPSEGSGTKLPYYTGDSEEENDPETAPDPPAQPEHGPPDGYDDAGAALEEPPAPGTGDVSQGVARRSWSCVPPT